MFDIASTEFLLVLLIALVVIGPKDLPKLLRFVGKWVAKARGVMAQFRSGFDELIRESELKEMEEKWKKENEHIMREFPPAAAPSEDHADLDMALDDGGEAAAVPVPPAPIKTVRKKAVAQKPATAKIVPSKRKPPKTRAKSV